MISKSAGLPDLFLIVIETSRNTLWDYRSSGFNAAVQFQPQTHHLKCNNLACRQIKDLIKIYDMKFTAGMIQKINRSFKSIFQMNYEKAGFLKSSPDRFNYVENWPSMLAAKEKVPYRRYPGVCPRWDNTPRRGINGFVFEGSTPEEYGKWLNAALNLVKDEPEEHRIVFINAWNEWGEGNCLEPDVEYDRAYLEVTAKTVFAN